MEYYENNNKPLGRINNLFVTIAQVPSGKSSPFLLSLKLQSANCFAAVIHSGQNRGKVRTSFTLKLRPVIQSSELHQELCEIGSFLRKQFLPTNQILNYYCLVLLFSKK